MSLTSFVFLMFCIALAIVFFLVPKKYQWWVLLGASLIFYSLTGIRNLIYILITSLSTFWATIQIEKLKDEQSAWIRANRTTASKEEKNAYKEANKKKRKHWLIASLVLNFGIMCTFKYVHFVLQQVNVVIRMTGGVQITDTIQWIIPLGISFYTFQTMGYLVDVYWEKVKAEHCYPKVLLFVSFFPQMTQGPISDFQTLTSELFKDHSFTYRNFSRGVQRMLWGFYKKLVLANILAGYVNSVFGHYHEYTGIAALIGAFMYSVQIYADFSGYMDIVCGLCEILDIKLSENFLRPYFSKSIAEYWRRWHITLGVWFKTYIYYPLAVARWNQRFGRYLRGKLGKTVGQTMPASIALVGVWITTGLWHGASWGYIVWGAVNGMFIIFSLWMEPVYEKWTAALHIRTESKGWRVFQVLRTFVLVTFIKVLPEVGGLRAGLGLWYRIFTEHTLGLSKAVLFPYVSNSMHFYLVILSTLLLFVVSMIQRGQSVRTWMEERIPYVGRIAIYVLMAILITTISYDLIGSDGGFMYAQF